MLSKSNLEISEAIRWLNHFGIEAVFFVPTETGLKKSIIDAHGLIREYLKKHEIHDYLNQKQGDKKIISYALIDSYGTQELKMSLYRPKTKKGDPRFWPSGFKNKCKPTDLIAMFIRDGVLHLLNLSDNQNWKEGRNRQSWLFNYLIQGRIRYSQSASRLLNMIREVYELGWIESRRGGSTGVGYTLESCLGIQANSSPLPDFEGIEIKAQRHSTKKTRANLFAKVADWDISRLSSSKEILMNYGYVHDEGLKLYCTVSSAHPNSQGLMLEVDNSTNTLNEFYLNNHVKEDVVKWRFEKLESKLLEKHRETFWVYADCKRRGSEYFRYSKVVHTKNPSILNFRQLIESGDITVDHLIKERSNGRVSEKGPLFKIAPNNIDLLIPVVNTYDFES